MFKHRIKYGLEVKLLTWKQKNASLMPTSVMKFIRLFTNALCSNYKETSSMATAPTKCTSWSIKDVAGGQAPDHTTRKSFVYWKIRRWLMIIIARFCLPEIIVLFCRSHCFVWICNITKKRTCFYLLLNGWSVTMLSQQYKDRHLGLSSFVCDYANQIPLSVFESLHQIWRKRLQVNSVSKSN